MTGNRSVLVLGSTGSIGTQALDVDRRATPSVSAWSGWPPAARDVGAARRAGRAHGVPRVAVAAGTPRGRCADLRRASRCSPGRTPPPSSPRPRPPTSCSTASPARSASGPTLAALAAGRTLALANKESLVAGGAAGDGGRARPARSCPVDSEHSALAQCLRGGRADEVARLVLTASGGPFRGRRRAELADVTVARGAGPPDLGHGPGRHHQLRDPGQQGPRGDRGAPAVRHPVRPASTWSCTRSRSCTRWSTFVDGSTIAQASPPDMRLPIALGAGLAGPAARRRRPPATGTTAQRLDVRAARRRRVPGACALARARRRAAGGCVPAVFNAANEEAVDAFLGGRCRSPASPTDRSCA